MKSVGCRVDEVVCTHGLKLPFEDGSSVCDRLSGSERVMRVSDEAHGEPDLGKLSKAAKQWVFE